jgi:hypothetical protein
MVARTAEGKIQFQRRSERLDLTQVGVANGKDFLKRDDVGIDVREHFRDAFDRRTAIHSTAFVDVVRRDPHTGILPRLAGLRLAKSL